MANKYKLLPEHEARFPEWRDKWTANALSTAAMTDDDRAICREAALALYAAAKLPPPKHIVFVPSPFVLAFAGGFAAARWHLFKKGAATDAATLDATYGATRDATLAATYNATLDATYDATLAATRDATYDATLAATLAATHNATRAATRDATYAATFDATDADLSHWFVIQGNLRQCANDLGVGNFGLQCATYSWKMWQGGNQWSAWESFLAFFQDVVHLPLDYSAYTPWRTLSEHSGPRIMHPDFCMISDRPELLTVDDQNRPHGENGPFCRWRDGSALYSWHGTRIPARWIEQRDSLDPNEVIKHENVEMRAAGAAIVGWPKMLSVLKAKVIDDSGSDDIGQLIELELPGIREPGRFLKAVCPRNGVIVEGVPRRSDIDGLPIETALAAQAWRIGDPLSEYQHPEVRT